MHLFWIYIYRFIYVYTYTYLINVHAFWHTSCAYVIITHILYIYIYSISWHILCLEVSSNSPAPARHLEQLNMQVHWWCLHRTWSQFLIFFGEAENWLWTRYELDAWFVAPASPSTSQPLPVSPGLSQPVNVCAWQGEATADAAVSTSAAGTGAAVAGHAGYETQRLEPQIVYDSLRQF